MLGRYHLNVVTPQMIKRVFIEVAQQNHAPQTQRLVYATLKKMFGDAVENYQYLSFNPVLRKIRPSVPVKEARHLNFTQVKAQLEHVEDN